MIDNLQKSEGISALAVQFLCLCASRSSEVRFARWEEIDLNEVIWTIPDQRMKTGKEHRVPLSTQAMEVLKKVEALKKNKDSFIFPSIKTGKGLSDVALSKALHNAANTKEVTIHGLRSTFRDWCGEATNWPRDVAEMALAHTIANKVEAAYRRVDLFAKRRDMMQQWADYCYQES
ncbi:tyrosine-type recombinase/integrase [Commensalibacter communis]|uniref:tyrosine-type recombinase/integrase n=1 Tax=Commensalibacter communis TaxID=2972786 RepID=UPI0022FF5C0B|nr:Integrase/recombinase [Commensalibacter communis]CAI3956734.1 Integrase/recombinase [Commensalibacter communis]